MKNRFSLIFIAIIVMAGGFGCGVIDRVQRGSAVSEDANSNKTLTDQAVDTVVGKDRIGVPECDEVLDFFESHSHNPDDDFVTKAVKATALNKIRQQFKKAVEEHKGDTAELAKTCREFKDNLEIFKAEEDSNKQ